MYDLRKFGCTAILAVTVGFAAPAGAATLKCWAGTGSKGAKYWLSDATASFCESGNVTKTITSDYEIFGTKGWILADKSRNLVSGDGNILFQTGPVNRSSSGSWSILPSVSASKIFIALKASSNFGAFLLDLGDPTPYSGTWRTSKLDQTAPRNLKNASIYYISAVPLPAGVILLGTALAGIGALRRRRRHPAV